MKLSFVLILIVSALLVGGASENNPSSVQPIAEKEKSLSKEQKASGNQEQGNTKGVPIPNLDKPSAPIGNQKTEDDIESAKQPVPSITDWIMVGVTTAYAVFALLQWRAIRRQANIAAEANRPFLMVSRPTVETQLVAGQTGRVPYDMRIKVKNYGIGPADIIDFTIKADFFDWHEGSDDPKPTYRPEDRGITIDSVIGAGEERQLPNLPFDTKPETFEAMKNDRKRLAFHGIINYCGGSRELRYWTKFFWWYFPDGQKLVRVNTPELNAHT